MSKVEDTNKEKKTKIVKSNSNVAEKGEDLHRNVMKAIRHLVTKEGSTQLKTVENYLIGKKRMHKSNQEELKEIIRRLFDREQILPHGQPKIPVSTTFTLSDMHPLSVEGSSEEGGNSDDGQIPSTSQQKDVPKMPSRPDRKKMQKKNRPKHVLPSAPTDKPKKKSRRPSILDSDSEMVE